MGDGHEKILTVLLLLVPDDPFDDNGEGRGTFEEVVGLTKSPRLRTISKHHPRDLFFSPLTGSQTLIYRCPEPLTVKGGVQVKESFTLLISTYLP